MKKIIEKLKSGTLKGIIVVVFGNMVLLLSKFVVWLMVPRLLGVIEYGYFKTFTLYLTYAMMLHFGFPDGILLIYGGMDYEKLNKRKFRTFSRFFLVFQAILAVIGLIISLLFLDGMDRVIVLALSIDAFFVNYMTYFKFISQAVMRFRELAFQNILDAGLKIFFVCLIAFLSGIHVIQPTSRSYILSIVFTDILILFWYVVKYKNIVWGKSIQIHTCNEIIKEIFTGGIFLTIAFQVSHLVFALDRQMVLMLFNVETYSLYSFAYSMTNMITAVIAGISTVMFPSLKRLETEQVLEKLPDLLAGVSIFTFLLLAGYHPLACFIIIFLPEYVGALEYLIIIFPGLAISCCINMIIFTYYKVLGELKKYLIISLKILTFGAILNMIGYLIYPSPISFSYASIITLLVWYLNAETFLCKKYQMKRENTFSYILVQIVIFYGISFTIPNMLVSMITYIFCFIVFTGLFYRKKLLKKVKIA